MNIEFLTRDDLIDILDERLPEILSKFFPKPDEVPVTGEEICSYCSISYPTLLKYRNQGKIPFIKIGKGYRYVKSEVKAALTKSNGYERS